VAAANRVNVICIKWGTKYGPHYVNRLRSMVARHLSHPHRFVCFTDDAEGIDAEVEVHPLPEVRLPDGLPERGWGKLGTFHEGLAGLEGPTLFLDLDLVVVGSLDAFFEHPGEFLIIRDYKPFRKPSERYVGNSSVYRFEAGAWPGIIAEFQENFEAVRARFRNEQEYLSHYVHSRGKLTHWPDAWCRSFKRDCMWKGPLGFVLTPRIPEGARIIVFHGHPHPDEAIEGRSGSWKRALRPTPWVAEHWR
jgi:hypothetical protein